jgi:DNA invertase Pin-like site-specific DNA recombinase
MRTNGDDCDVRLARHNIVLLLLDCPLSMLAGRAGARPVHPILGGLAEFERELIRARTDDGRKRAQARGVEFGRPTAL